MKKLYILCIVCITICFTQLSYAVDSRSSEELKNDIIPSSSNAVLTAETAGQSGESFLDALLDFLRDSIFALMALIAIGMFLFIGGRLIVARGNPEEMKKAIKSFIYVAIGIFLVAAAWAIVRLIVGLDI